MFKYLAKSALWCLGWHPIDVDKTNIPNKAILVYSHTTYWDFALFALYRWAYPQEFGAVWTLVKPQAFNSMGWLLRRWQCLPATPREVSGGGATDRIVETLSTKEKFIFLISPKGTLQNKPWRTGYRVLAQRLGCPIWVGGLNYETHQIYLGQEHHPATTSENSLQAEMGQIVPLHPERSEVPIRVNYHQNEISAVDWIWASTLISAGFVLPKLWRLGSGLGILGTVTTGVAMIYHSSYEAKCHAADRWAIRLMGLIYGWSQWSTFNFHDPILLALMVGTLVAYVKGRGRKIGTVRETNYSTWHPWFHILLGLTIWRS